MITGFQKFPHLETWKGGSFPSGTVWRPKVKLHGTNAAVRFEPNGTIVPQSQNRDLTVDADNNGFAACVRRHDVYWRGGACASVSSPPTLRAP